MFGLFNNRAKELREIYEFAFSNAPPDVKLNAIEHGLSLLPKVKNWPDKPVPLHRIEAGLLYCMAKCLLQIQSEKQEYHEQAIQCYCVAISIFERDPPSKKQAECYMALAVTFADFISPHRAELLEEAITLCSMAKEFFGFNLPAMRNNFSSACGNLATFYCERLQGTRQDNIRMALKLTKEALDVWPETEKPEYWHRLKMQHNKLLAQLNEPESVESCIEDLTALLNSDDKRR